MEGSDESSQIDFIEAKVTECSARIAAIADRIEKCFQVANEQQKRIYERLNLSPSAPAKPIPVRKAYLGPIGVSELLAIPEKTLAEWRSQHIGPPYYRVGKHIRYLMNELEGWLSARKVAS